MSAQVPSKAEGVESQSSQLRRTILIVAGVALGIVIVLVLVIPGPKEDLAFECRSQHFGAVNVDCKSWVAELSANHREELKSCQTQAHNDPFIWYQCLNDSRLGPFDLQ